jgi:hypothetical protein
MLCELWNGEDTILLGVSGGEWREANHEQVKAGERNNVHSKLPEVRVELAGETQRAGYTRHDI